MAINFANNSSQWIAFLRQYGPISRNDNMYDETIQRVLKRKRVKPIEFEVGYQYKILKNIQSESPASTILTGTAGDGKTYCCRQVWERLGGSPEEWQKDDKVRSLELSIEVSPVCRKLVVIKDLSELTLEEKNQILPGVAGSIRGQDNATVYLIAANDGQLIEAWAGVKDQSDNIKAVRQTIEELLVSDRSELDGFQLRLYNLSRQSAATIFPQILDAVLQHPGWEACESCSYQNQGCPIWENKKRLEGENNEQITRKRLIDLLLLCDLDDIHLPIRQLLILISNAILGHPDAKDKLLDCRQVSKFVEENRAYLGSLYRNIFGENLSERRRSSVEVFKALRSFGIGKETTNQIDNILIFGEDDPELKHMYQKLMLTDLFYGANAEYVSRQVAYLERNSSDKDLDFLDTLKSQRQRLFFTVTDENLNSIEVGMKVWRLTVFRFAGEYLNEIYRKLESNKRISGAVISRLVKGLNRIFTGRLVNNQDELVLATSGSYSQAKRNHIYVESISVKKDRGEYVSIEQCEGRKIPQLIVCLSPLVDPIGFELTLTRYEYLNRVAEGALPGNFSQECYEDLLAFKAQVLQQLEKRREKEGEREGENDNDSADLLNIKFLKVDSDGIVSKERPLEIYGL